MALELKGVLRKITPTETLQTKAGNTFKKRMVVLDCSYTDDFGEEHNNIIGFEVGGNKCDEIGQFIDYINTKVVVQFGIQGRTYEPSSGDTRYIVSLRCVNIVPQQPPIVTRQEVAPEAQPPTSSNNRDGLPF